ncbi:amino acid carrier protein [Gammaproteobacteria bacterium]|nr:amino acid carrier protein [Gammaproteobacteria bacterium]
MFDLNWFDELLWSYLSIPVIIVFGGYLTIKFKVPQICHLGAVWKELLSCYQSPTDEKGVHPLHAFFTTMGGCIGVGNLVAVCTAVKIGGPGALFWMWVTALVGMSVKYAEIYLSVQTRQEIGAQYVGGPMYYISTSLSKFWGIVFAVLLSVYGIEVYMFKIVTESLSVSWHLPQAGVSFALLLLVLYAVHGGAKRVGQFCSVVIPLFVAIYMLMSFWVLLINYEKIPAMCQLIFQSAWQGHAPIGAFAGSSVIFALSQGVKRACYTGDIGVGYAGVVAAQATESSVGQQARFSYIGIILDTFVICTLSVLLILISGVWQMNMNESEMVTYVLSQYFPGTSIFMPIFIFLLGYSTIIAFFHVGLCCMEYISPRYGRILYYVYAVIAFMTFAYLDASAALALMNICGAIMLVINVLALWLNRSALRF